MNKFIKGIITFSLKNKLIVFLGTLVIVGLGVQSFLATPIEAFPDVINTRVVIITQWPGRSAEEMEKFVTIPIEIEMNVVPKKTSLRSISLFGLSVVTIFFEDDVDDFYARQVVYNQIENVTLPDGVDAEVQPPSGPTGEIYRYTLDGGGQKTLRELKELQDWVIDKRLKAVPGVAFQQRGAGINHTDVTGGAFAHPWIFVDTPQGYRSGDPDSTHLDRLRFSTLEMPLTLLLRTPKDIFQEGMRLSAGVGPTLIHTSRVNQTFQSVIDGSHPYNWVTDNYIRNDLGYQVSLGADIDSGGGGKSIFQIHFVYTQGLSNVFAKGQADGRQTTFGVRFSWLF